MSSSQPTEPSEDSESAPALADGPERLSLARRLWPRSLTSRLVLTSIALVAAVSMVVIIVTAFALRWFLLQRLDAQVRSAAERSELAFSVSGAIPAHNESGTAPGTLPPGFIPGQGPGTLSGLLDERNHPLQIISDLVGDQEVQFTPLSSQAIGALSHVPVDDAPHTVELEGVGRYRVVVDEAHGHTIVSGLPMQEVDGTIGRLVGWEALVALVGVLLAAGAGQMLVRRQLRPLHQVAATAQQVSAMPLESGRVGLTARVPADIANDETEVGHVGLALNVLLGRVEEALDARHHSEKRVRQFVGDASHELRTPLSTIQGYAELSRRRGEQDPAGMLHALSRVEGEAKRMASLVDDLLLLARLDSGRPLEKADVDVTRLTVEAVNDARVVASDHAWRLELPDEPLHVLGDEQRLHQVVSNLVTNASRHTGPGTTVTVGARQVDDTDELELTVHDDGAGLPPELSGSVFERFSRADNSRTRSSGGTGLGLSIVHAIVMAHDGTVEVESRPGATTFTVTLPCG